MIRSLLDSDWICLYDTVLIFAYTTNIYDELLYLDNLLCYNTALDTNNQLRNIQNV